MIFEMIATNVCKVLVTQQDLNEYGITYETLDYNSDISKEFLSNLIEEVIKISGNSVSVNKSKVYVESFPDTNGGCILFVSLSQSSKPSTQSATTTLPNPNKNSLGDNNNATKYCYTFDDVQSMVKAVTVIMPYLKNIVVQSKLYKVQKYYSLVISYYGPKTKITNLDIFLKEYTSNNIKLDSKMGYAYLHFLQQGECTIEQEALEKVYKYL